LALPSAIAVDCSGDVYVADQYNDRIQRFDNNGAYITQWGSNGTGTGQFAHPETVVVDYSGNVYVADYISERVQKFDNTGTYISQFGSYGTGNGQFDFGGTPSLAVDGSGNVYVVDQGNRRVQKFDNTGTYISQFGSSGSGNGQFSYPRGIALDISCNVFVADGGNNRIEVFGLTFGSRIAASEDFNNQDLSVTNSPSAVKVYPNPSQGTFTVSLNGTTSSDLVLYNSLGETVFRERNIQADNYVFSNQNLSSGIYNLRVTSNGISTNVKVVIN
ncbi:MAG TPA: 6-bladed beta-propeller, partial [Cytophagaceae bacterium]|nr:6-bladed beta-propeller [Cytophagaceae bacterium]